MATYLSSFWVAITVYHRLGDLCEQKCIWRMVLETGELKNMVPVSGEGLHAMANHARR